MIKAVIFDFGGVLFTNGSKKLIEWLCKKFKLDQKIVDEAINGKIGVLYREGKIGRDAFWEHVLKALKLRENIDVLENEWVSHSQLIEGTKEIVLTLSKKYKVYYLSDNIRERVIRLHSLHDVLKWFDGGIFSYDVGIRKPHPDIYKLILKKAGVLSSEAVFIDDKEINLPPAQKLGMKTILFKDPKTLRKELGKLGIQR